MNLTNKSITLTAIIITTLLGKQIPSLAATTSGYLYFSFQLMEQPQDKVRLLLGHWFNLVRFFLNHNR